MPLSTRRSFTCKSAWGPDADRRAKLLICLTVEGSFLDAYSQIELWCGARLVTRISHKSK
jgi:hypothetical protein